ncbi:MAG: proline iminopeptidase-family hydrolase [Sphingomonadales bacterium]|nr:proline iminopeptidase-family hydrolase [Sphingomonadales bacterium]
MPGVRIAPDREEMISVPGGRAYVRINGDLAGPRPPIVMLHGGPGSAHWYFLNGTVLADERAVILYDQLDSGRSDHPADPANWQVSRFVAELEAIRTALRIERWHVLGASWGGTVLLEHAATRPASLASAILQSPLVSTDLWLRDANRLRAAMPAEIRRTLDACDLPGASNGPGCEAAMNAFYARHVRRFAPSDEIAAYKAAMPRSFSEDIYHHMWGWAEFSASGTLKDYDGLALLQKLEGARTLFVAGEHDEAMPATVAGFARQAGARFREVPQAAHSVMNDNPAAYVALLREWMAGTD